MNPDLLLPEVRKAVTRVPRLPFGVWGLNWLARLVYDLAASSRPLEGVVNIEVRKVHGREHRIIRPSGVKPARAAAVWFHGGGHLAGKPSHLDGLGSLIASQLGITFIAPAYRLAPRRPFPADLDDALATWHWVISQSELLDFDPAAIAIGGNSAGGGIAAALAQRLLGLPCPQPRAQVLFYPMLDDRVAANHQLDKVNHFIWNNKQNRAAWSAYLAPNEPQSDSVPPYAAAARSENLQGLPPAWIGQCGLDLFLDEYKLYASRLQAAGVEREVCTVEGVPHAFETLCPDEVVSKEFVNSAMQFLGSKLESRV